MKLFKSWLFGDDVKYLYRINKISLLEAEHIILMRQLGLTSAITLTLISFTTLTLIG